MSEKNPNARYVRELIEMGDHLQGSRITATEKEEVKIELVRLLKDQFKQTKEVARVGKETY